MVCWEGFVRGWVFLVGFGVGLGLALGLVGLGVGLGLVLMALERGCRGRADGESGGFPCGTM